MCAGGAATLPVPDLGRGRTDCCAPKGPCPIGDAEPGADDDARTTAGALGNATARSDALPNLLDEPAARGQRVVEPGRNA